MGEYRWVHGAEKTGEQCGLVSKNSGCPSIHGQYQHQRYDNRHQPTTKHHQIRVIARFEEKVLAYPPAQVARVTPGIIVAGWEFDIRKYQRECKPALGKR